VIWELTSATGLGQEKRKKENNKQATGSLTACPRDDRISYYERNKRNKRNK